jgi:segregation and condensation protein B
MAIKSSIESLLFIAAKPMSVNQLADLIKVDKKEIMTAGDELVEEYKNNKKGVQIIKSGSSYQMVSAPENAMIVQEFIKDETTGELSRPSLEALTIIAYRGPISKLDLDRIRGVNCALILRNLLLRGLIEADYNKTRRETYYHVAFDFIRFLGINNLEELPDYDRLHKDDTLDKMLKREEAAAAAADLASGSELISGPTAIN